MSSVDTLIGTITGPLIGIVVSLTLSVANYIKGHTHDQHLINFTNRITAIETRLEGVDPTKITKAISIAETIDPDIGTQIDKHDAQIQDINNKILDVVNKLQVIQSQIPQAAK